MSLERIKLNPAYKRLLLMFLLKEGLYHKFIYAVERVDESWEWIMDDDSFAELIDNSFEWYNTFEGHDFWLKVEDKWFKFVSKNQWKAINTKKLKRKVILNY